MHAQVRQVINFNNDWKFYLGNDSTACNEKFDDASWRKLNLPHDWSIEGNFAKDNPATTQGGALPGGIGWYRKTFSIPAASKNKNIAVEFEGVYRNSEVWINGHYLGKRPNGYISFRYDITQYVKFGNQLNSVAVKVDNAQQPNSRWYTGSGIYRDVKMIFTNPVVATKQWSVFVTTGDITKKEASIFINTKIVSSVKGWKSFNLFFDIYDAKNKLVSGGDTKTNGSLSFNGKEVSHSFSTNLFDPHLWSVDDSYLYKAVVRVMSEGKLVDKCETPFGIRSMRFDRAKGFFLNEKPLKLKGVCLHHDLGALGAAFNVDAAARQLRILKEMGCNAIRTSHNPAAPGFLDLCDQMGFLVMEEAYDMWRKKKNKFDYSLDFKEWHKKDLQDMILRDRNHPSIFMWSIGNEIREQIDSSGIELTKELVSIVKNFDNTRPVTSALTEIDTAKNFIYQSHALDVIGWNYNEQNYPMVLNKYPNQIFIASETTSGVATRGHYDMPADSIRVWPPKGKKEIENVNGDWTASAYDNARAYWGSTHEFTWKIVKKFDFLSGMFVWTGFDYLGEPTPYPWPARSSYFGIVDLAGFPKDVYYMYQSEWTAKPVLHLLPHWNWKIGDTIDVWAYYNQADEIALFLNGKFLGSKQKPNDELHVKWRVPFEPGILKAITKKNGKIVLQKEIRTAGAPYKINMQVENNHNAGKKNDLAFVQIQIVDKEGNIVPDANNLITFSLVGDAKILATDNGYQADTIAFNSLSRNAWKGKALAIIKFASKKGNNTLMAKATGLLSGTIALKTP